METGFSFTKCECSRHISNIRERFFFYLVVAYSLWVSFFLRCLLHDFWPWMMRCAWGTFTFLRVIVVGLLRLSYTYFWLARWFDRSSANLFDDWSSIPPFFVSLCFACSLALVCLVFQIYSSSPPLLHPVTCLEGSKCVQVQSCCLHVDAIVF